MEEDTEYLKLPLEDRCVHKLWKARVNGYEECVTYFAKITDEKSPEFTKFAPLMKKFVTDTNAVALDKALDAVLSYVENAHIAAKTAGEVTAGIVAKCLGAPKKSTQDKALDILLMYCEIEKYEPVQEELTKGFSQKNPKVASGCVRAVVTALREFGSTVISIKSLVKSIGALLEDRDKNVREEAKKMVIEMYRWVGAALKPQLTSLKPIQIQELEVEFEKIPNRKPVPTRVLRSQQQKKIKLQIEEDIEDEGDEEAANEEVRIDPLDLMSPVNILNQLSKDFYEKVEAKKWQERKEAMDELLPLSQHAKLEPGDYFDLVKVLKKIIAKDTNVMIIALAGQCLTGIAKGLKKKFSPYAVSCTETILEKFKEKKQNVVTALREAVDAIFHTTSVDALQEVVCAGLNNKNPSVKAETASFLARSFAYCTPDILNKKLLKTYVTELLKTISESDQTVRDNSAEALGTALKVVGEKVMNPFLTDVDALKMQKIKESSEKAEIKVKIKAVKSKPTAKSAPPAKEAARPVSAKPVATARVVKPGGLKDSKRPGSAPSGNQKPRENKGGGGIYGGGGASKFSNSMEEEDELGLEEALEKAQQVLPEECITNLADTNWKVRLIAVEEFIKAIQGLDASDIPAQALIRVLADKPGFKDNNFQVVKLKLDAVKYLAENSSFKRQSASLCFEDLVEKFGDPKNGNYAGEVLTAVAEATSLQWVATEAMNYSLAQKNPKAQEMTMKWLSSAIREFGLALQPKSLISSIKSALSHSNPGIRTAAITLCGTMYLYMGPSLRGFFEDEKASVLQQIDSEFEKVSGESPPAPTRGQTKVLANGAAEMEVEEEEESNKVPAGGDQEAISRVNISSQITPNLISELEDKNWKVRIEALSKVSSILHEAKLIQPDIGELPDAICARLSDTNKNIAAEALRITSSLAAALGQQCKMHTRIIVPGIFAALGDTKQSMRQQALVALNNWSEHSGSVKEIIDGEMCIDVLKSGSLFLRTELIMWMSEKLRDAPQKSISKDELNGCVDFIFSGLEDRNAEIRKVSNEAIFPFMLHLGYEGMVKHTAKVKPSSKNTVMQALDKAKPNLPARLATPPQSKSKTGSAGRSSSAGPDKGSTGVGRGAAARRGGVKSHTAMKGNLNTVRKDEEVDNSPLLQVNNLKQQRTLEEQRMRTLRWDFATPRPEFVTQLKDQMLTANMNRQLVANMFHQDFKFHIKAIDALSEDLVGNIDACTANLDLILRWLTIRFFDTNPSVILKAMEYLQNIFTYLSEDGYHMIDYEAYSFLPYIIVKFGDPKDSIRGPARNIIKVISHIYPAGKISPYILEGLKSKNARLRAECLESFGSLIEVYGITVCQPSPGTTLKEVAKQIADRDNSVRNAALNCLLQVYFREGDKVYKFIGHISDKEHSLLEERIKRAVKNKPVIKKPSSESESTIMKSVGGLGRQNRVIPTPAAQPSPVVPRDGLAGAGATNDNAGIKRYGGSRPLSGDMSNFNARFQIDYDFIEKLVREEDTPRSRLQFELEEIPDITAVLSDTTTCPVPTSRLTRPGFTSLMRANVANANVDLEDATQAINMVISQVATPDVNTVVTALSQLDEVIQSEERRSQLISHIDQLLIVATLQYRLVLNTKMADTNIHKEECIRIYRSLTNCLMSVFNNKELGIKASRDVLHDVIHAVISILLDSRLTHIEDGPQVIRALNVLVVRIIEKAQFTQIFSALLRLLHESIGSGLNSKFTELVMKCNWKGIRILPSRSKDLNPVQILQDAHDFMAAYPSSSWADRPTNTPLRTIKTVLHNLVKTYGSSILTYLSKVPNTDGSEIQKYILKDLNSLQKSGGLSDDGGTTDSNRLTGAALAPGTNHSATTGKSPKKLSKDASAVLSEIFKKVGDKENTKEGLIQLYEFKQKYPDADIDTYLRKSSAFFQNYIERGLKKVEMERQGESKMSTSASSDGSSNSGPLAAIQVKESNNVNMNELVDQFKAIAAQAGFDNTYIDSAVKDIYSGESKTSQDS